MNRLLFLLPLVLLVLVSCSKEEETPLPPPTPTYKLSFSAEDGGTVSTEGGTYNQGSKIMVTATPDGQYLFKEWSDGSTVNPREITVNADLTLKATFVKKTYPLSVTIDGEGTVQEQVIIQGSTTETQYNAGTTVRLTATANEGWVFAGWTGDIESGDLVIEVPIEKGTSVSALFKLEVENYILSHNSYYNQRSGIVFRWGDFRPDSESNMNMDMGTIKGWFAGGQAYHDIDNDGLQDILVTYHLDENNSSTDWYLNQGDDKTFRKIDLINSSTNGLSSHKILKTDVNNDDLADFILLGVDEREAGNYGGNFTVLLQTEDNRFDVISIDDGKGLWYHNGAAGDLNNDGFVDVVTATYIWLGDGTGNFTNTNISLHDYNINPALTYEIIDINNDGFNDIVGGATEVYSFTSGIVLGKQNGFDTTNQVAFLPITNSIATNDLEFLDVDNDGDLDILEIKEYEGNGQDSTITRVLLYVNNNLNFTLDETMFEESIDGGWIHDSRDKHGWGSFKIDDIDGDGNDDIVAENKVDGVYNGLKLIDNKWRKYRF